MIIVPACSILALFIQLLVLQLLYYCSSCTITSITVSTVTDVVRRPHELARNRFWVGRLALLYYCSVLSACTQRSYVPTLVSRLKQEFM